MSAGGCSKSQLGMVPIYQGVILGKIDRGVTGWKKLRLIFARHNFGKNYNFIQANQIGSPDQEYGPNFTKFEPMVVYSIYNQ